MKLFLVLLVCAAAAATPVKPISESFGELAIQKLQEQSPENRSFVINALIRQLIAYLRRIINNGSSVFGIPPLDPLVLDHLYLNVPAEIVNMDLELDDILVSGIGGFVVHKSNLDVRALTFDIDISVPMIDATARQYDMKGNLFGAIPLYGKGDAKFEIGGFRFRAVLHLKQSDDLKSVLIDRVEAASFEIPSLKTKLAGVIGGGDIDGIVNAMIDEVIIDYVNRFQGVIANIVASIAPGALNPILDQLNTWNFIDPFIPRN